MLLAVQRVKARDGREGVNVFVYRHGFVWAGPPPFRPEDQPGHLIRKHVELSPPGNRVRSFLDILVSDDTPVSEVSESFLKFLQTQRGPVRWIPHMQAIGRCWFHFHTDPALTPAWETELLTLFGQGLRVLTSRE